MGDYMEKIRSLNEIVKLNSNFKTSINLYLSLNKSEKILSYIPTKSSADLLEDYLDSFLENKNQATLLIGPYGKGKSHLLLVLLAVLSMERNKENSTVITSLIDKFKKVDGISEDLSGKVENIWTNRGKFLPVLISDINGNLNQAFLMALNEALKRNKLSDLVPDTFYSIAIKRLIDWEREYPETYEKFQSELRTFGKDISDIKVDLMQFSKDALNIFSEIYPKVTAGSEFAPLSVSEALPLFKGVSERLVEDYGYSGIYIVFDEFSKFIEGQTGNVVGNNMKLLQDICELAADSANSQIHITMVTHKSIKEYGKYLPQEIINSFIGIEGRIIEKYFITSSKNNYELIKNAIIKDEKYLSFIPEYSKLLGKTAIENFYQLPVFKSNFEKKDFINIILQGCYPLNPVAAYLLLNVSEKVAQNERTLFTFISNDEPYSMANFVSEHDGKMEWSIGADLIYDYFSGLFKKDVLNEYIHNLWLSAEYALTKCENENQKKVIKALAIILIVNKEDEIPADEKYLPLALAFDECEYEIEKLMKAQIIYKKGSTNSYVFKTRAGSELRLEIKRQKEIKGDNINYAKALENISGKHFVIPKKYNSIHMMTRYFKHEYMKLEDFLNLKTSDSFWMNNEYADGKVITLYSFSEIDQELAKRHIHELGSSRLVIVCPKKPIRSIKQIREYEIIQELRENRTFTNNNEILKKELPLLEEDLMKQIEDELAQIYEDDEQKKVFYFNGEKAVCIKSGNEETAVNECCELIFYRTPILNNELINRRVITTAQTRKARLNIVQAILSHTDDEDFYGGTNQEATIYRSLFGRTGLMEENVNEDLGIILAEMHSFVESCSDIKTSFKGLISRLTMPPYGMRTGVIPVYLAYVLAQRHEDIVVYFDDMEVQMTADIVVNMCECPEDYALFVSGEDLQKEKYIGSLNELFEVVDNRNLSTNRIKNIMICMQRWFRALPQIARNVPNLKEYDVEQDIKNNMLILKKILQKIEFNPYEILFVSLPTAFSISNDLEGTYLMIDKCKTAFDDYFDWMQRATVEGIYKIFGGRKRKDLFHIIKEWYEEQSNLSKKGLHSGRVTSLMSCIEKLKVYDDIEVSQKMVKAVGDVYLDNWSEGSYDSFINAFLDLKHEVESIRDESIEGKLKLSFIGKNGKEIEKFYDRIDENTGSVLRNLLEDNLDEYDDLSVNDRVCILLEMIEKIIG